MLGHIAIFGYCYFCIQQNGLEQKTTYIFNSCQSFVEEQLPVAFGGRFYPLFGDETPVVQGMRVEDETPVVQGMRVERPHLFDAFHQVIAQVFVGGRNDAACQFLFRDARPFGQQVTSSVAPVRIDGYGVGAVKVERCAVC